MMADKEIAKSGSDNNFFSSMSESSTSSTADDATSPAHSVDVRFLNHVKGNGLFAKRSFQAGELVFRERALLTLQFPLNRLLGVKACEYCLETFEMAENSLLRYLDRPGACQEAGCLPLPEYKRYGSPIPKETPCSNACGVVSICYGSFVRQSVNCAVL